MTPFAIRHAHHGAPDLFERYWTRVQAESPCRSAPTAAQRGPGRPYRRTADSDMICKYRKLFRRGDTQSTPLLSGPDLRHWPAGLRHRARLQPEDQ